MRKIIQITAIPAGINGHNSNSGQLFALCDDGALFSFVIGANTSENRWFEIMPVPQDKQENETVSHHDMFHAPIQCKYCNGLTGQHGVDCPAYGHLFKN